MNHRPVLHELAPAPAADFAVMYAASKLAIAPIDYSGNTAGIRDDPNRLPRPAVHFTGGGSNAAFQNVYSGRLCLIFFDKRSPSLADARVGFNEASIVSRKCNRTTDLAGAC